VGAFAGAHITPSGTVVSEAEWEAHRDQWLPTEVDKAHVRGLMHPVLEPGKIAGWIAPPSNGINDKPVDFEYVHFN
jgi:benzoyl-CoA 2,3-dioxygenase component B